MRSDWETLSLRDAGVALIDCDHRTPKETESGYPYITIPQLSDGRIRADEARRISHADFVEWTKKLRPREHDVIVVRRCSSGDSAVVPRGLDCAIGQNLVVLRADGKSVLPPYLRWLVRGSEWWEEVRKYLNVGAVFDSLKCKDIPNFELPIPPLDDQTRISDLLNALDDRIDHNRALAANLEAIARALFKSWFVDFDPVRAKAAGEAPSGLAPDVAALFPDRFVNSELGEIPEGWDAATLEKVCSLNPESWTARKHPDQIEYVDLANVKAGDIENRASYSWDESPSRARRVLRSGDTIVGTVRPGNRSFALIAENGLTGSTGFAALRPSSEWLREFVYLAATSDDAIDRLTHLADGAAYPAVRPDVVIATEAVIPDKDVLKQFSAILKPLFDRVAAARSEIAALSQLRDLLLPRLVSGKLRVEDAEAAMEAA